jgi:hypothetical protein
MILIIGTLLWLVLTGWILEKSGSALPRITLRRLGLGKLASTSA